MNTQLCLIANELDQRLNTKPMPAPAVSAGPKRYTVTNLAAHAPDEKRAFVRIIRSLNHVPLLAWLRLEQSTKCGANLHCCQA